MSFTGAQPRRPALAGRELRSEGRLKDCQFAKPATILAWSWEQARERVAAPLNASAVDRKSLYTLGGLRDAILVRFHRRPALILRARHVAMNNRFDRLRSRLCPAGAVLLLLVLGGCPTAGVYRTARTLNQGQVDIGILASGTHIESPGVTVTNSGVTRTTPSVSRSFLNLPPELNAHYGIKDSVEIGGRLALSALLVEVDVKCRLVGNRNATTHLAIAPAVGYQLPCGGCLVPTNLLVMEGPRATLPLIFTQDLGRILELNLAVYGGYRQVPVVNSENIFVAGASVGLEFHGTHSYFMPLIDFSRTVTGMQQLSPSAESQTYVILGLALGAIPGIGRASSSPDTGNLGSAR